MIRKLLILILLPIASAAQLPIPEHGGVWVHDEAGILSPDVKQTLENILKAERDSTTNQIAILIIPSLNGELLESYSLQVAEKWKIGKKDRDNGVLWLIAIKDRDMRIEVGSGLEGALTDALSSRINRNEVAPRFKQGKYEEGVLAGTIAIIQGIKGQYVNNDPPQKLSRKTRSPWTTLIFIALIIFFAARRKGGGGRGMGGMWVGGAMLGGMGRSSGSWGSSGGGDFGGGGGFGGGGSSDSW